jgi:hypothetical protein
MRQINHSHSILLAGLVFLTACASTGTPTGGPKDETPPKLLKTVPLENQLNYKKKRVEIYFDELISIENSSEKVLVSPPQKLAPSIKTSSNKAVVVLLDSLLLNTTYTIDFTDAIVDYNEKNKYGDYAFSFSTGDYIDSLRVSGIVIDASNLNPVSGILVGTYTNLNDSSFRQHAFECVSRTSQNGHFCVKGMKLAPFHVYALGDKNRDYKFDQPGESIAFCDSISTPWTEPCLKRDTIWKDSTTIDTILVKTVTCYKPDDIILRYFTEDFGRQYLAKKERSPRNKINLSFGYKSETLPKLTLLNSPVKDWCLLEKNPTNDTLSYWITDTLVSNMDTLQFQIDYYKSDSLNKLIPWTDTLKLISRSFKPKLQTEKKPEKKPEKKQKDIPKKEAVVPFAVKSELQGTMDVFCKPRFQWEAPVKSVQGRPWHLYIKKDTLWFDTPFVFEKDTTVLRDYLLSAKWEFDTEYKFELDSGMIAGIYGTTNKAYTQSFKIKAEEEYSRLTVSLFGLELPAFAELMNKSDNVVRRVKVEKDVADFKFLSPGSYYVRVVEDRNDNFKWDTGNYALKLQPENVYYNPREFSLRANWDVEESWNVHEYPLLEQKPAALKSKTETGNKRKK